MEKYQYPEEEFTLLEQSCIPLAVYQFIDRRVVTVAISDGFCRLFALDRSEVYDLMNNDMYRDTHPDDVAELADHALRFAREESGYDVYYRSLIRGKYHIIHAVGFHTLREGIRLAVINYMDEGIYDPSQTDTPRNMNISRRLQEESLLRRYYYDNLTGLPSMTHFMDLAAASRAKMAEDGKTPAILYFDIAGLKYYNHKFGFPQGDQLIRDIARILAGQFGSENCSRFGQDHFAVLTSMDHIYEKLEDLKERFSTAGGGNSLPVRIGVYPDRMGDVDISSACDRAKYACDSNHEIISSRYRFFDETMLKEAENRQYFITHLDRAIQENWIQVYYQPIVRIANGRVSDEEALARWIDPEKGMMSPGEFIPVLEDTGLICKLDLNMLDQILLRMTQQKKSGLYVVPISLNLSRADFDICDMVEEIRRRVDDAGIPHDKLTIEITESIIGSDFEFIKEQVLRFQELGFRVWMDDFGSGYSSLDVLQNIHFDLIKFDMRFMQKFFDGDESRIILQELVRMAIGLGIDTVAEGVEYKEQAEFLREIGCTKLQGYYFCRPISNEQVLERYRKGIQIGFENPDEADYYEALGRVNLFDMSSIADNDQNNLEQYFRTMPMAVLEIRPDAFTISRCNQAYRDFLKRNGLPLILGDWIPFASPQGKMTPTFLNALRQCAKDGGRILLDEENDLSTSHSILRRVAVNPVTGTAAIVIGVLSFGDDEETRKAVTYANIAKALARDYTFLYYVNVSNGQFTEFRTDPETGELAPERYGEQFFTAAREDAVTALHPEDVERFLSVFSRENVLRALDEHQTFVLEYRLLIQDIPRYVTMKASRMPDDRNHIIIGVSNVDAQIRERESMKHMLEQQTAYARINALAEDYICIYTVIPETGRYTEFNASMDYRGLGLMTEGTDFFEKSAENSIKALAKEDVEPFQASFTLENVMNHIEAEGYYQIGYHLLIHEKPVPVTLKAVRIEEKDGPKLVIGVSLS